MPVICEQLLLASSTVDHLIRCVLLVTATNTALLTLCLYAKTQKQRSCTVRSAVSEMIASHLSAELEIMVGYVEPYLDLQLFGLLSGPVASHCLVDIAR